MLEIIRNRTGKNAPQFALFDFDGTISLIREGWQDIMLPLFTGYLRETPRGKELPQEGLEQQTREMIALHTGKQTIYQCIALAEQVKAFGGEAGDPQDYKDRFSELLSAHIRARLAGLAEGSIPRERLLLPGVLALLQLLRERGLTLFLASGTDEPDVLREAELLGVAPYFEGRIYGAQRAYQSFSKQMVIQKMLRDNALSGEALLGVGDGYVEIENVKEVGGLALGVASEERLLGGRVDAWKRERLIAAGADAIVPDYEKLSEIEQFIFGEESRNAL